MIKNDQTLKSIVAKIKHSLYPESEPVEKFESYITDSHHDKLCYAQVTRAISKRATLTDSIVFFGIPSLVQHAILVDQKSNIVTDTFAKSGGLWYNGVHGSFYILPTGQRIPRLKSIMVKNLRSTIAAVDPTFTNAFIKSMLIVCNYFIEGSLSKELVAKLRDNSTLAQQFVTQFKLNKKSFDFIIDYTLKGKDSEAEIFDEHLVEVGLSLKTDLIVGDNTITHLQLDFLKDMGLWLRTGSEAPIERIERRVSKLGDSDISQAFMSEIGSQKPVLTRLRKLVKQLVGIDDINISLEDRAKIRVKKPEQYKQFLALRKDLLDVYKKELRSYVRSSGKPLVEFGKAVEYFESKKMVHTLPEGFNGLVDEEGALYTQAGKRIDGVPGTSVEMNPNYSVADDNSYVFESVGFGKGTQRYYTLDYKQKRRVDKFKKVATFIEDIESVKKKWEADIKREGDYRQILGTLLELLYQTSARVGSVGNATAGQSTYGIATLLVGHVRQLSNKLRFSYVGKKGVKQQHDILPNSPLNKKIIGIVLKLAKGKKPKDRLFTFEGKPISGTDLNKYLKSLGVDATVHKMRHVFGTSLLVELLKKCPLKAGEATQQEAEQWYKKAVINIGAKLGHVAGEKVTPLTAIKSYLDADTQINFFKQLGLRTPKFLTGFEQ